MKIWFIGKVYDLDATLKSDIEADIKARLHDYTGCEMGVDIDDTIAGQVDITIFRSVNKPIEQGYILMEDKWLMTGEGYNGMTLPYGGYIPIVDGLEYKFDAKDFLDEYKQNAHFFGASKIKSARVEEYSNRLTLRLKI